MPRVMATAKPKNLTKSIARFLKTLRPYAVPIAVAVILSIGAVLCSIFGPKLLGQMTDVAVESYQAAVAQNGGELPDAETLKNALDWAKLGNIAITLIILYATSAILNYIQGVIFSVISARYAKRLRAQILEKIMRLPMAYFDRVQIGDTLSRMSNDINMISNTLSSVLTQIISSITSLIGILVLMLSISVPLSLIALVAVPLSLVFVSMIAKKAQNFFRAQQTTLGALNSVVEEDFSGQMIIKANTYEPVAIEKFEQTNGKLYETAWKAQFYGSMPFPITHMFTNLSYVLICVIGGKLAIDGKLLIGSVQAFIQYINQFNRPITEVSQITANIQQSLASAERVFEFLDEKEETPDYQPAKVITDVKGAVEFHNVDFAYNAEKPVIQNFSVKIEPGMQVAIVGPTGAGIHLRHYHCRHTHSRM